MTLPRGVRLGVDVGAARVGLAQSDPDGLLATPVQTLPRESAAAAVAAYAAETESMRIYLGLPRGLSGAEGAAAKAVRDFVGELIGALDAANASATPDLRLVDERFTTVSAHQALRASGRKTAKHRPVVDQVAAVMILQGALDAERDFGQPAGQPAG